MEILLVLRERLKKFYGKQEVYITPTIKFLAAFVSLLAINSSMGYMSRLSSVVIVLVLALMCSFLPMNALIVVSALLILAHSYALSLECLLVVFVILLLLALLYFRFSPKDAIMTVLTPVSMALGVPYIVPLSLGLVRGPASAVSVVCGVIVYYVIDFIHQSESVIQSMQKADDEPLQIFAYMIDGLLNNKEMLITAMALAVCLVLVYMIRRLSIDHAWTIAIAVGVLTAMLIQLIGDLTYVTNISIFGMIFGGIVSVLLAKVLEFFVFHVDYHRTEHVQFEDDEYYYYVKAIPKVSVTVPERTVTRINAAPKSNVESKK